MRALTPDSQRIAISCFQDGVSAEATTQAVNCLRGADQYAIDDIRGFQRADPLFLSQQILHLESQRHGIENATGGIDDQIKALKSELHQALTQKISTLQRQSFSLTNMDGSISRQIQDLKQKLDALVAQNSLAGPMPPALSSSQAIQSTRHSQHDNPPLHAPSTSRLGPQSFPSSLQTFQSLDTARGQSGNHRIETQAAPSGMPIASIGLGQPPTRIKPTDAQIQAYALNADGTIRTFRAIRAALHENGFFATTDRITEQTTILQSKGFGKRKTHATDDQIRIYSRNADGSKRTTREIASALRNANFSVANDRIVLMTKPQPRDANNNAMDD